MNNTKTYIEKVICPQDAGIAANGHNLIRIDCIPSTGDFIEIDGVLFLCERKEIRMDHGNAYVTLTLKVV
jgi:hypothetical protein